MKFRWAAAVGLVGSLFLLASCGTASVSPTAQISAKPENTAVVTAVPTPREPFESPVAILLATVVKQYDKTLLLAEQSGQVGEIYLVSCDEIPLLDADGNQISTFQPGESVAVSYDGWVLETYPAQIVPSQIQIKEEPISTVSLYVKVLETLYQEDPGLNDETRLFAFDFTKATSLTQAEKSALCYVMGNEHAKETLEATFDQLCQEGYVDKEKLQFPDGLLFTVSDEVQKDGSVTFSASKWRGGLGAVGWEKGTAQREDNYWRYETGSTWIS